MDVVTKKRSKLIYILSALNSADGVSWVPRILRGVTRTIGNLERYIRVTAEEEGFEPSRALRP